MQTWLSVFTCAPCVGLWQATELTGVYFRELPVCYLATRACAAESVLVFLRCTISPGVFQCAYKQWKRPKHRVGVSGLNWLPRCGWTNRCVRRADGTARLRGVASPASATETDTGSLSSPSLHWHVKVKFKMWCNIALRAVWVGLSKQSWTFMHAASKVWCHLCHVQRWVGKARFHIHRHVETIHL